MSESNITFRDLGLSEAMLKALEAKGYGWPTTIQAESIPHFMPKAKVLPVPVGALAMTSRHCMKWGMLSAWMVVGQP